MSIDGNGYDVAFLDRDGTLIRTYNECGAPATARTLADAVILDGARALVNSLHRGGRLCILLTNQPDISRGITTLADQTAINRMLMRELPLDDVWMCPHTAKENCDCRKPKIGMVQAADEWWGLNLRGSIVVGNTGADRNLARNIPSQQMWYVEEPNDLFSIRKRYGGDI